MRISAYGDFRQNMQEIKCIKKKIWNCLIIYIVFCGDGVMCFSLYFVLLDSHFPAVFEKAETNHLLTGNPCANMTHLSSTPVVGTRI
jgi:hypothetical protein